MKNSNLFFRKMIVVLLTAIIITTMCPVVVMAAGNTYSAATPISFGKRYSGTLSENDKVDWYKFTLSSGGILSIQVSAEEIRYIRYNLYEGNNGEHFEMNDYSEWSGNTHINNYSYRHYLDAGTYYFAVKVYDSSYINSYGDYSFTINFTSEYQSFVEPYGGSNNSLSTANDIKLNTTYYGLITCDDSKDYYKFYIPSNTEVTFSGTSYFSIYVDNYDSDGNRLRHGYSTLKNGSDRVAWSFTLELSGPATYYISIYPYYDGSEGPYNFIVEMDTPPASGWVKNSTGWWYRNADGSYPKSKWQKLDGKWYYFDDSGYAVTGWKKISNEWYYFEPYAMVTGWKKIKGNWYYFKEGGAMAHKEYCKGYYLNPDGTWTYPYKCSWTKNSKGWWYGNSKWYAKNCSIKIDGKIYVFDANGYCKNP